MFSKSCKILKFLTVNTRLLNGGFLHACVPEAVLKNVTRIWLERMPSVQINFHQPLESTGRMDEAVTPNKECILTNAFTHFGGSVVTMVHSFGT